MPVDYDKKIVVCCCMFTILMESDQRHNYSDISSDNSSSPMAPGLPMYHDDKIDHQRIRYPHCIVWTPIPCLTYVYGSNSGRYSALEPAKLSFLIEGTVIGSDIDQLYSRSGLCEIHAAPVHVRTDVIERRGQKCTLCYRN